MMLRAMRDFVGDGLEQHAIPHFRNRNVIGAVCAREASIPFTVPREALRLLQALSAHLTPPLLPIWIARKSARAAIVHKTLHLRAWRIKANSSALWVLKCGSFPKSTGTRRMICCPSASLPASVSVQDESWSLWQSGGGSPYGLKPRLCEMTLSQQLQ